MKKIHAKGTDLTLNQQKDLLLLLGTFKSFSEQLYNLKGAHSKNTKKYFNMMLNSVLRYERQIDQDWLKENKPIIEDLNDAITDLIYMLREDD